MKQLDDLTYISSHLVRGLSTPQQHQLAMMALKRLRNYLLKSQKLQEQVQTLQDQVTALTATPNPDDVELLKTSITNLRKDKRNLNAKVKRLEKKLKEQADA